MAISKKCGYQSITYGNLTCCSITAWISVLIRCGQSTPSLHTRATWHGFRQLLSSQRVELMLRAFPLTISTAQWNLEAGLTLATSPTSTMPQFRWIHVWLTSLVNQTRLIQTRRMVNGHCWVQLHIETQSITSVVRSRITMSRSRSQLEGELSIMASTLSFRVF